MQERDWHRLAWLTTGLFALNAGVLAVLWLAPMPPRQLPHSPSVIPTHSSSETDSTPGPAVARAADLVALDEVLAGRLAQVAQQQGVPLASVSPDPATREAAFTAVDPHSAEALALLAAYADAFAALDPEKLP